MTEKTMEYMRMDYLINKIDDEIKLETVKLDVLYERALTRNELENMLDYFKTHPVDNQSIQLFYAISVRLMEEYYSVGEGELFERFTKTLEAIKFTNYYLDKVVLDYFLSYIQIEGDSLDESINIVQLLEILMHKEVSAMDVFLFKIIAYDLKSGSNRIALKEEDFNALEKCIVLLEEVAISHYLSDILEYHVELFATQEGMGPCDGFLRKIMYKTNFSRPKKFYGDMMFILGAFYSIQEKEENDLTISHKGKEAFTKSLEFYESIGYFKRHGVITNVLKDLHLKMNEYENLISLGGFSMSHFLQIDDSEKSREWLGIVMSILNEYTVKNTEVVEEALKMVFKVMIKYGRELKVSRVTEDLIEHCMTYKVYDLELELRNERVMNMEKYDLPFDAMYMEAERVEELKAMVNVQ